MSMQLHTTRVNPSEENIKIGPLGIRFLLTGDDSNGSASVFEVLVPVGQKLYDGWALLSLAELC